MPVTFEFWRMIGRSQLYVKPVGTFRGVISTCMPLHVCRYCCAMTGIGRVTTNCNWKGCEVQLSEIAKILYRSVAICCVRLTGTCENNATGVICWSVPATDPKGMICGISHMKSVPTGIFSGK